MQTYKPDWKFLQLLYLMDMKLLWQTAVKSI